VGACPTVTTERLLLRPFRESDLDRYHDALGQPEVFESLGQPRPPSRDDAWEQMAVFLGQWELRGTGQWALEERATGRLIGRAGLHQPERVDWPGLEVGWTLHPDAWGHGYATEAGRAAIDYAFEVLRRDEVVSIIAATNTRSQAVATRLSLRWVEDRTMAWNPGGPLGIWQLSR
jgi:[ribosomal protein S5]-alanine N-acetyltransferase